MRTAAERRRIPHTASALVNLRWNEAEKAELARIGPFSCGKFDDEQFSALGATGKISRPRYLERRP
jgi:hypothetical protein